MRVSLHLLFGRNDHEGVGGCDGSAGVDQRILGRLQYHPVYRVAGHGHFYQGSAHGVARLHVGDEVAQRIDDQRLWIALLVAAQLHGLNHMRVGPDDQLHPLVDQQVGQLLLCGVGQQLVFVAPVQAGHNQFGLELPGPANVVLDACPVYVVDDEGWVGGEAVGAVGVVEEGDAYALDVGDKGVETLERTVGLVGAYVVDAEGVEPLQRAPGSTRLAVEAVVVGGEEEVETRLLQGGGKLVGGREAGVARVGGASRGGFEIDHGIIGRRNLGGNQLETARVVIALAGAGRGNLGLVLHGIARKKQGNFGSGNYRSLP